MLTGRINEDTKFAADDFRSQIPRFNPENLDKNIVLADYVAKLAEENGATPAQVALGWILAQKPWIVPIPGTKKVSRIEENIGGTEVKFTKEELDNIRKNLDSIHITGARYPEEQERLTGK